MKKLLFAVSALAALSLLAPTAGFAQDAANQFGIYAPADPGGPFDQTTVNPAAGINEQVTAYLVLTNPINHTWRADPADEDSERAVTAVDGWEAKIIIPDVPTFFTLNENVGPGAIDIGTKPDYVVGYASPLQASGNAVILCTWTFLTLDGGAYEFFLDVTDIPSIPGTMAYQDNEDSHQPLVSAYASSGDTAAPVFSINGNAVAVENESWGGVKALFK